MQSLTEIIFQIKDAAKVAESTPQNPEKKLRELISPIWENFLKEKRVGLNLQIRDELTLANGRADTVFNRLILEYKKPYAIKPDNNKNRQLITQVQGYILDFAKKERFSKKRLLGVAFDGDHFLFMRYVGRWIVDDPLPVNESNLEIFLKNLEKLTSKTALIPENLIRDFAVGRESRNKVAVDCIKAFYHELNQHSNQDNTKEHVFFEQWKIQFAEVHGSLEQKKIDKQTLFTSYGFSKNEQKDFNVLAFFFALDSYYALLMKLLSYQVVGYYTISKLTGLPLHDWETLASDDLKRKCSELEEGGIFRSIGIRNFLEGDLFSWYIEAWNESIYRAIQQIIKYLNDYDPETMEIAPDETRDILKKLYQYLVPKQIRHDLGEYYTPDWLAERTLNQVGFGFKDKDLFKKRLLDPGCGSGTFVILAIKRAKEHAALYGIDPALTLQYITMNIMGFDLNPLAVISARTNYIMAIADLLKYKKGEITIPIYLCDSINPPQARVAHEKTLFQEKMTYEVKTIVGNFYFSHSIISKKRIQQLANLMEDGVKTGQSTKDFLKKVERELQLNSEEAKESESHLIETYEKLLELERKGINGVWARIIKNAFAPQMFIGHFDLIVGNPPWVNWEALPQGYRDDTKPLWVNYGLFSLSGHEARLGGGKKDISMLMMYVAIDKYLKNGGKLCFVITQTLFKTQGAGDGFRRFKLGEKGKSFKIEQVDDMVDLQPFEGATNRTAVVTVTKGSLTVYPVSYLLWKKINKGVISIDLTFDEVLQKSKRSNLKAQPIDNGNQTSPWISAKPKALSALQKVIGKSDYTAIAGSCTWLNGVFWGTIRPSDKGYVNFSNLYDEGKIKIDPVEENIESTLVYPLLRGREISRWKSSPASYIIVSQNPKTRTGYDIEWMENNVPMTLAYFERFKDKLIERSGYKKYLEGEPYYSIYNVSEKTFTPYKVVWKEQGFDCAVISSVENKVMIPDHKLMLVPFHDEYAAHYVCALLNSVIARLIVKAYCISTSQSTHILENVKIPKYERTNNLHQELSHLSKQCHEKVTKGIKVSDFEEQIDEIATELWDLSKEDLRDIKDSLEELK
jgi:hypothetical protein